MKKSLLLAIVLLFFTGCAQKITIQSIQSSKVSDTNSKQITVMKFKHDNIGQSASVISEISNLKIEGKPYFTIVERDEIERILQEKRLNDSALVDIKDLSSLKGLTQAKSLLAGEVVDSELRTRHYNQVETNYNRCVQVNKENKCVRYAKIFKHCQTNAYNVLTQIKLIEIESAQVIFSERYQESENLTACGSQRFQLEDKNSFNSNLAKKIAKRIIKDIAPSYTAFHVVLLEESDVDLNDEQEQMFENALHLIKESRVDKAQELFKELNVQTVQSSYVINYNLAVTYEALNSLKVALELYENSENIALRKDDLPTEISQAIVRVKHNLNERLKVKELLK